MSGHAGGCLCGKLRYEVDLPPLRVTICYCRFCQRATGSTGMVEPIFPKHSYAVTAGSETIYSLISEGSGKQVHVHFCSTCGTKVRLSFERFADIIGVYAGTFDEPNWFERSEANTKHIFVGMAQRGTIVPAGYNCFEEHATTNDGVANLPQRYDQHRTIV
jgi:hypothetical protein